MGMLCVCSSFSQCPGGAARGECGAGVDRAGRRAPRAAQVYGLVPRRTSAVVRGLDWADAMAGCGDAESDGPCIWSESV